MVCLVVQVMHLDIKPQNVLLDSHLQVKLLDFGLSAAFKPERAFIILQSKGRGTRPYTAPELVRNTMLQLLTTAEILQRSPVANYFASWAITCTFLCRVYCAKIQKCTCHDVWAAVQLAGSSGTVSPAADIYSLGCCLAAVCAQSRGVGASSGEPPDIFGLLKKGVKRRTDLSDFAPPELHSLLKVCTLQLHSAEPVSFDGS